MSTRQPEQAAEQLKARLQLERGYLSKSQLKKRRKQLSKLYKQAQPAHPLPESCQVQECCLDIEEGCSPGPPCTIDQSDTQADSRASHKASQLVVRSQHDDIGRRKRAAEVKVSHNKLRSINSSMQGSYHEQSEAARDDSSIIRLEATDAVNRTMPAPSTSGTTETGVLLQRPPSRLPALTVCRVDLSCSMLLISQSADNSSVRQSSASLAATATTAVQLRGSAVSDDSRSPDLADAADTHQPPQPPPAKRQRRTYVHGNYRHYYGYRLGAELAPDAADLARDPRLDVLQRDWFRGRRCVDVGCNEGVVTLALATEFGTARMLGVDIDRALIAGAARRLAALRQHYTSQLTQCKLGQQGGGGRVAAGMPAASPAATAHPPMPAAAAHTPAAAPAADDGDESGADPGQAVRTADAVQANLVRSPASARGECPQSTTPSGLEDGPGPVEGAGAQPNSQRGGASANGAGSPQQGGATSAGGGTSGGGTEEVPGSRWARLRTAVKALAHTSFRHEDWVNTSAPDGCADVVTCLSVTKWVHLNGGDDALMCLFNKVFRVLSPGGLFVLEPQPWRSYQQAKRKQDMSAAPFADLKRLHLRPNQFLDFLTQRVGFQLLHELQVAAAAGGFIDRPIYVLQKPASAGRGA